MNNFDSLPGVVKFINQGSGEVRLDDGRSVTVRVPWGSVWKVGDRVFVYGFVIDGRALW